MPEGHRDRLIKRLRQAPTLSDDAPKRMAKHASPSCIGLNPRANSKATREW
jgi:hypothetical protein